jgi:hypothetical protein
MARLLIEARADVRHSPSRKSTAMPFRPFSARVFAPLSILPSVNGQVNLRLPESTSYAYFCQACSQTTVRPTRTHGTPLALQCTPCTLVADSTRIVRGNQVHSKEEWAKIEKLTCSTCKKARRPFSRHSTAAALASSTLTCVRCAHGSNKPASLSTRTCPPVPSHPILPHPIPSAQLPTLRACLELRLAAALAKADLPALDRPDVSCCVLRVACCMLRVAFRRRRSTCRRWTSLCRRRSMQRSSELLPSSQCDHVHSKVASVHS